MKVADVVDMLDSCIDRKGLSHFYEYLSSMLLEEPPITSEDCFDLIGDFLTDGMIYSKDEAFELCEKLIHVFIERGLRDDLRNSIVPKTLKMSICIGDISDDIEYDDVETKTDNLDPLLDYDKYT